MVRFLSETIASERNLTIMESDVIYLKLDDYIFKSHFHTGFTSNSHSPDFMISSLSKVSISPLLSPKCSRFLLRCL